MIFALTLMGWGLFSFVALCYTVYLITRLSISFFQANGLINHPEVTEAVYFQVFDVEPIFFFMLLMGFAGVGLTAYIFSQSQFNYFKRLGEALNEFSFSGKKPVFKNLGPFAKHAAGFIEVVTLRIEKKGDQAIDEALKRVKADWPLSPKISWIDQLQFAGVTAMIAAFFTMLSLIFFWKITDRLIELSGYLVRYKVATGPLFFNAQSEIVSLVMTSVLSLMVIAFAYTGFCFGRRVSEASYAVLRDLRRFMENGLDHRVILRGDDPAKVLLPTINDALTRIEDKIRNGG